MDLNKFKDIFFIHEGHKYVNIETGQSLISVTTALKKYQQPFDEDYWSAYKAKQYGVPQEKVLQNWKMKNEIGLFLGSLIHDYIEAYQYRKLIDFTTPSYLNYLDASQRIILEQYKQNLKTQADQFIKDFKHYNLIQAELVVGNDIIAGQIDYPTQECILDFKNDREIEFYNKYQNMKYPLNHLSDCNYNKYCLQVSMYRLLLEESGAVLKEPDKIIKFDRYNTTYKTYEIPYLKKECKLILKNLKNDN